MIRHIVTWNFAKDLTTTEKTRNAHLMKTELEALLKIVPGILSLEVITETLPSSNCEIALYSSFASIEALAAYQIHPEHQRVSQMIGNFLTNRTCLDFIEE
ncbi:antibiotic biosynthesis monooxygenase (ABM) superfamily enzyme [Enterococcus sp. PF1-24]|uniref:Dabb family protein n=1 Tax=unclassified Enterococcus TaxID=2608891 RepID=UPI0024765BBC|nr:MULTISPECIES: Dabb family protein [unclassified Enterococcus]MDH6363592.1 antibiotic biosynthesis monooxygenase (ABM) superfamily enzyme [Enterococcus sp. PFB1-1]MDH6400827.1 antibiotic biosynthesis monooxygenase (ABM) superfamily enzyme [Enterococcus sp. PF1-24]